MCPQNLISPGFKPRRCGVTTVPNTVLLLALMVLPMGCSLLKAPKKVVESVVPVGKSKPEDPVDLQVQIQRFTDAYSMQTTAAVDEYVRRVGTETARIQGLQWKLAATTAAITIASGPKPKANLLDLVSLATLNRKAIEGFYLKSTQGPAFQSWLETSRNLETNAWELAASTLTTDQANELRAAIDKWRANNPGAQETFAARPYEFASLVKATHERETDLNSVFSLVGLDPTAGLDPAVREVTRTRLLAERALYVLQRMPPLLRWQIELMANQLATQPSIQTTLTNMARLTESADRASRAAESFSQTATQLPDRLAAEREAVMTALNEQEGKLRELAVEVDRVIVHTEAMSSSLNAAITNFDALMKRFGVGEPSRKTAPDTNRTPFNILDYGQTAAQIAHMAKDLNVLITSANQSTPQLERLGQQSSAELERVVERAFWRGLLLILVLLIGSVAAGLAYRVLVNKIIRNGRSPSAPHTP